ncbi:MAG TPA: UTP--glucose-1-phosphate uridylyltransferase [Caldilineae bacterium]|nr:UTP--glucose-1-phosphate uridylyltransferase [Caldilineae bacterium]
MRAEGLPDLFIRTFRHYYAQLLSGETGLIPEDAIEPVTDLPDAARLDAHYAATGRAWRHKIAFIKLNGGLGTSMGLRKAKSLLTVKDGLTFLDIIARHALHHGIRLSLMNSFNTRADSLALLERYPDLWGDIPLDFLQHKAPKIWQDTLEPVSWPADPALAWAPPGHGDIYTALVTSGMLETLLAHGIEYAFVSNADNLGAALDDAIFGYFIEHELPFMMEVADRTPADRKGGHLARRKADGQLILRESAQCPEEDAAAFQDVSRHRYFNTNNLWYHLPTIQRIVEEREGILGLPMIVNKKTVDPRDPDSTPVYQLETAMGSAIAVFPGAQALRVPRTRFSPVKTTNELLAVRSDAFLLTEDYRVALHPGREGRAVVIDLDKRYYKLIDEFDKRFPDGPPSLLHCDRLVVRGDVVFKGHIVLAGEVEIINEDPDPYIFDEEQTALYLGHDYHHDHDHGFFLEA